MLSLWAVAAPQAGNVLVAMCCLKFKATVIPQQSRALQDARSLTYLMRCTPRGQPPPKATAHTPSSDGGEQAGYAYPTDMQ
eukprot:scaffold57002_cov21-Tisochrysis_lutea.AAC.1